MKKKNGLDSDILKNYRPVSNLTFISEVIEKVISGRLNEHLINNSLFDPLQSAYRDKHSTETALIKVQNDILSALDAGSSAILLMLDLSAAFDTIDHDILLSRLCNVYGITGNSLDWFRSYLTGRIQRVVIEDSVSVDQELDFGVPQGSVLGPRIYCMYTKPVSDIIQRHGLSHHSYADDTQLFITMDHSNNDWRDGLARIELCVSEIREWMNQNILKLRPDFLFCGLRNSLTCFWEKLKKIINLVQIYFILNTLTCIFQEIEEKKLLWVIKKIFRRFIVVSWQYMCRPSGINLPDRLGELLFFNLITLLLYYYI